MSHPLMMAVILSSLVLPGGASAQATQSQTSNEAHGEKLVALTNACVGEARYLPRPGIPARLGDMAHTTHIRQMVAACEALAKAVQSGDSDAVSLSEKVCLHSARHGGLLQRHDPFFLHYVRKETANCESLAIG